MYFQHRTAVIATHFSRGIYMSVCGSAQNERPAEVSLAHHLIWTFTDGVRRSWRTRTRTKQLSSTCGWRSSRGAPPICVSFKHPCTCIFTPAVALISASASRYSYRGTSNHGHRLQTTTTQSGSGPMNGDHWHPLCQNCYCWSRQNLGEACDCSHRRRGSIAVNVATFVNCVAVRRS